jgi:hypothetical protein
MAGGAIAIMNHESPPKIYQMKKTDFKIGHLHSICQFYQDCKNKSNKYK